MSYMGQLLIEGGEEYERRHPETTWEKAMEVMTSDNPESREIYKEILEQRRNEG